MRAINRVVPLLAVAALAFAGMGVAQADSAASGGSQQVPSQESGTFDGPDGLSRSMNVVEGSTEAGMELDLAPGDELRISDDGSTATWVTAGGVELIEFNKPEVDGVDAAFSFDAGRLTAAVPGSSGLETMSCWQSKATEIGWNVLWSGLVCVPLGIGTAPAGGAAGFACSVAGSGVSTFVPWEDICG